MDEFDLLRNVTVGQYLPGSSVLHRMDPRAKFLAFCALLVAVSTVSSYLGNIVAFALVLLLVRLAGIPLGYALRGLRPAAPLIAVFVLLQLLFGGNYDPTGSPLLWEWTAPFAIGPVHLRFSITEVSLRRTLLLVFKVVDFLVLASLLTLTTDTTRLSHAVESLLRPFRVVRVPAHEIAMIFTIALRFVPTLAEETERIMKAQASRGADFGGTGRFRFIQTTKNLIPIMVPLFVLTFRRAEELILAMEARCYLGGEGRSSFTELTMHRSDWVGLVVSILLAVVLVFTRFPV